MLPADWRRSGGGDSPAFAKEPIAGGVAKAPLASELGDVGAVSRSKREQREEAVRTWTCSGARDAPVLRLVSRPQHHQK